MEGRVDLGGMSRRPIEEENLRGRNVEGKK
jgi:hypothetical protein